MNETIKTQIKSNGWHEVEITGNIITGETYKCKEFIKNYLGGKWSAEYKGWIVNPEKLAAHTTPAGTITSK